MSHIIIRSFLACTNPCLDIHLLGITSSIKNIEMHKSVMRETYAVIKKVLRHVTGRYMMYGKDFNLGIGSHYGRAPQIDDSKMLVIQQE